MKIEKNYYDHGLTIVTIIDGNEKFVGVANCHPDDSDVQNELTGETIATQRALIKMLKHQKKYDIKPRLHELRNIKTVFDQSNHANKQSYEYKTLCRYIEGLEYALEDINNTIKVEEKALSDYINDKEQLYQHIRNHREKVKKAETN